MREKVVKGGMKKLKINIGWLVHDIANIFFVASYFLKLMPTELLIIIFGLQLIAIYSALTLGIRVG
jgi:uncharacterized membrane protein